MTVSIDVLLTPPSADTLFNDMILGLVKLGIPADKWRAGGVGRSIIRVVANTFATFAILISVIAGAGFLETATDEWLTLVAKYVYGVSRILATAATGPILVSNSSGSTYNYAIGAFTVINAVTGKSYTNSEAISIGPGATNFPVTVVAVELGTASNADVGQITKLGVSAPGVTVTNAFAILGVDAQLDDDLRDTCLGKLAALSMMGPRGAYAYAIRVAKRLDGTPVNINRWAISPSSSTGRVTIVLASPTGPADAQDVTAVGLSIESIARPDTAVVSCSSATTVADAGTLRVWAQKVDGLDATSLGTMVQTALAVFNASPKLNPIGGLTKPPSSQGYVFAETIEGVAQAAHSSIYAVDAIGFSDLALTPTQVAVLSMALDVRIVTGPATS